MAEKKDFLHRKKKELENKEEQLKIEEGKLQGKEDEFEKEEEVTERNERKEGNKEGDNEENLEEENLEEDGEKENKEEDTEEKDMEEGGREENEENQEDKDEENEDKERDNEEKDTEEGSQEENGGKDKESKKEEQDSQSSRKNINPDRKSKGENEDQEREGKDGLKEKATKALADKIGKNETINKINNLSQKAISVGKSILNSGGVFVKTIINPIFWIAIGIIVLIIAISSAVSVIGGNDYNQSCDYNGVGSVNVADDADAFTRQSAIASWLMSTPFKALGDKPMSKEQAVGIIGNLIQESFGANPKAMQGSGTTDAWKTCGNDCVIAISGGGKAFGILQWDSGRRTNLAKFAKEKGTEWHDLSTQLEFLKVELDGAEKGSLARGFSTPGKSIAEYTMDWSNHVERCGTCHNESRVAYSEDFGKKFTGGVVSSTPSTPENEETESEEGNEEEGEESSEEEVSAPVAVGSLSTQCVTSGGSIDTSSVTQLAISLAWTREDRRSGDVGYGVCADGSANCGESFSKPAYIEAKKLAQEKTSADPDPGLLASCDRFVATVIRLSGIDEKFPWGATRQQLDYVESSPDWSRISCQERKPGDVLVRDGHIMLYIGEVDGVDSLASASIAFSGRVGPGGKGRSAHIGGVSCVGELFNADDAPTQGYRKGGS